MYNDVWELLRMYTVVVNYKLKKRGRRPKRVVAVLGAICSRFLLAMQARIIRDYKAVLVLQATEGLGDRLNEPTRAAIATHVSDFTGARTRGRDRSSHAADTQATAGPIRWNSRGPSPAAGGLQSASGKVRSRSNAALGTTGVWEHIRRASEPEPALGIESCGARLLEGHAARRAAHEED